MGNRLTLPLLLLAALLAGAAFFWMTGESRRSAPPGRGDERAAAPAEAPAPAVLTAPAVSKTDEGSAPAPARVELPQVDSPRTAPQPKGEQVALTGKVVDRFGTAIAGARVSVAPDSGFP